MVIKIIIRLWKKNEKYKHLSSSSFTSIAKSLLIVEVFQMLKSHCFFLHAQHIKLSASWNGSLSCRVSVALTT